MNRSDLTQWLKNRAAELGFMDVRIAQAMFMDEEVVRLENWLSQSYHGSMAYMERHFDQRVNPSLLVDNAKSVVCFLFNYYTDALQEDSAAPKLSIYAYGQDYHDVIKQRLRLLLTEFRERAGDVNGRCFVDSAPILERDWARRAGLGWVGKHTLLLSKKKGSFFFLAEMILDIELDYDHPVSDHCGNCTRCIDACPTDAISPAGYVLDASRCISYLTIELREAIPAEFKDNMDNWMFGCDVCQQVCPWNRFSTRHSEPAFEPHPKLLSMNASEWKEITQDVFNEIFRKSAVKRTKYEGLKRNIDFLNT